MGLLAAACGSDDGATTTIDTPTTQDGSGATTPAPSSTPPSGGTPAPAAENRPDSEAAAPAAPIVGTTPDAAEGPSAAAPDPNGVAQPGPVPGADPSQALPTEPITFAGPNGELFGDFASPPEPRGAVLVIHENRGLNDHIRSVAGRFAAAGYAALALDLLSEEGGTASLGDVANATAALGNAPPERFVADMRAALDELERRAPGVRSASASGAA
jgi:carboxymethylenebutenolidase